MKKKLPVILGAVIVIATLTAMLLFAFGGDHSDKPAMDLTGSWKIVMDNGQGIPEVPADDLVVFEADQATIYRGEEVLASSTYKLGSVRLELPEMSRGYDFTRISEHLIKLVMTADNYMYLCRVSGDELEQADTSRITGKWNVLCHGGSASTDECIEFENGTFALYKSGAKEPSTSAPYVWNGSVLSVSDLGMDLEIVLQTNERIVMVQTGTSYVWELQKASK